MHIPDKITVDLSKLDVGQSLHVRDIKVPETIKIVSSPGEAVATLVAEEEEIPASEEASA